MELDYWERIRRQVADKLSGDKRERKVSKRRNAATKPILLYGFEILTVATKTDK